MTPEQILQDFTKDRNKSPEHTQELIKGYAQVIRDWCGGVIGDNDITELGDPLKHPTTATLQAFGRDKLRIEQRERAGIKR